MSSFGYSCDPASVIELDLEKAVTNAYLSTSSRLEVGACERRSSFREDYVVKVLVRVLNAKFVFVAVFVAPMGCLPLMFCSLATLCIGSVLKEWAHARNSSVAY